MNSLIRAFKRANLPTKITFTRIAVIPFILFFYIMAVSTYIRFFTDWGRLIAAIIFILAAATDWIDGYIARKHNMVTDTGKLLDPIADKLLTLVGFVLILADPIFFTSHDLIIEPNVIGFTFWFAVLTVFVMLGRDIVMNSLRMIASEKGITIAADNLGKIKSAMQYIAIVSYMLLAFNLNPSVEFITEHQDNGLWLNLWAYVTMFFMGAAAVLSMWSCGNYINNYARKIQPKEEEEQQNDNRQDNNN